MMLTLQPTTGVRIVGAATVWPEDILGSQASLGREEVFQRLLGDTWQEQLETRGWAYEGNTVYHGVRRRGWTRGSQLGSLELGIEAAKKAIQSSPVQPGDINLIFAATSTPSRISSTQASRIAKAIGSNAAAQDIRAGGAGGINALASAALYHRAGCKYSLIIACEAASHYMGNNDLNNALIMGDGAAALVLASDPDANESGLLGAIMGNVSAAGRAFTVPGQLPPDASFLPENYCFQKPDATYLATLTDTWQLAADALITAFPEATNALDCMLPYAVTDTQLETVARRFTADHSISTKLLEAHGCIGCASPLAAIATDWLANSRRRRTIGSLAVAGGVTWSGVLWGY